MIFRQLQKLPQITNAQQLYISDLHQVVQRFSIKWFCDFTSKHLEFVTSCLFYLFCRVTMSYIYTFTYMNCSASIILYKAYTVTVSAVVSDGTRKLICRPELLFVCILLFWVITILIRFSEHQCCLADELYKYRHRLGDFCQSQPQRHHSNGDTISFGCSGPKT